MIYTLELSREGLDRVQDWAENRQLWIFHLVWDSEDRFVTLVDCDAADAVWLYLIN